MPNFGLWHCCRKWAIWCSGIFVHTWREVLGSNIHLVLGKKKNILMYSSSFSLTLES
jgi:hypothetical protein